jgi:hypothetical protein
MIELNPAEEYYYPIGLPEDNATDNWMKRSEGQRINRFLFSMDSDCIHAVVEATLLTDRSLGVIYSAIVHECTTDETITLIHEAMPDLDINSIIDECIEVQAGILGETAQDLFQRTLFTGTESKWQEALERYRAENPE